MGERKWNGAEHDRGRERGRDEGGGGGGVHVIIASKAK